MGGTFLFAALTLPASAEQQQVTVRLPNGEVVSVTVDVPPGASLEDIEIPFAPADHAAELRVGGPGVATVRSSEDEAPPQGPP